MESCSLDFETRSTVDLKATGVYPYAAHASTGIWCMAYAFGDEEPAIWTPADPFPERLAAHVAAGGELRAWNAPFEYIMWRDCARRLYGFPDVPMEQFVDTAAEAAAMSLPRQLGWCALVLGLTDTKDTEGHALMMRMARPRSTKGGEIVWWNVPERLERLYAYCKQDVVVERAVAKVVRRLSPVEREVYLLTQRINDRGLQVDVPLVRAMRHLVGEGLERANAEILQLTAGAVAKVTETGKLREWLDAQVAGDVPDVTKSTLREMLEGDLPSPVRRAIEVRADAGRTSNSKLDAMLRARCADDRVRGLLVYHGASTGRWAGKLVQPQNFPRGDIADAERFIPDVMARDFGAVDVLAPALVVVSSLLRGTLRAAPGKIFRAVDYSQIEARVTAWLAGQTDLVQQFADNDKVYERMGALVTGEDYRTVAKNSDTRQLGKATVLGAGFGMGWKKFIETAAKAPYFLELSEEKAQAAITAFRSRYAGVPAYWHDLNRAAFAAVQEPGTRQVVGPLRNVTLAKAGGYLWLKLPSGRVLAYPRPQIEDRKAPWGDMVPSVTVEGMDSYTHTWRRYALYGGLLTENVVQATARDLMADGMLRAEAAGHTMVLTVHDEVVSEDAADDAALTLAGLSDLLRQTPAWAVGCPVDVEGWEGERYRK